jgi:hypothetical protein
MKARFLRRDERTYAQSIFGKTIPFDDILITDANGRPLGPLAPFESPTGGSKYCLPMGHDGFRSCLAGTVVEKFVSGLTHVWQRRHAPAEIRAGGSASEQYEVGKPWRTYSLQQQARMVADWVAGGMQLSDPRASYISRNIRAGVA